MSLHRILSSLVVAAVAAAASPATAQQLYAWHDSNGQLVVSNLRQADGSAPTRTYSVSNSTIRTTRYVPSTRTSMYDSLIEEHASLNGVRSDLVRAVVQVESAYNTYARSPKGALGLMQLMPATLKDYGVHNPFNPTENIRAGVAYLRALLDRYQNDETLALAAYNAGPTAVDNHGQTVPPYRETKNYVKQVNKLAGEKVSVDHPGHLYKVIEYIDGRPVPKIVDKKPTSGIYEVIGAR
ncbi:MAG TPA: lytic transglycosylase domain-containing protein [Vicinamibacterales bacterium]|nr:lytic transglycosylase domain-containing protein [Vicinamibacterales bacterium]